MTNFSSDVPLSSVKVEAQKGSTLHRLVLFPLLANSAMKDTERYGRLNLVLHCFILFHQIVVCISTLYLHYLLLTKYNFYLHW